MLSGKISYEGRVYNVIGTDSASSLRLRMSSNKYDDILFMASGKEDGDELWERTVEIKVSTVTVETHVSLDSNGKKIKSPINTEMFCRIGAFIRYIKSHCYVKYIDGYIGLQLASGDYTPESETSYKVPLGTSGEFANIRLKFGEIVELSATYGGISVELLANREEEILPAPKDGVTKGIAFNKEYLHFDLEEQSVELSNTVIGGMYRNLEEVMRAHPEKEFEWLLGKNYQIVTDETLEEVCDYIYNYDGYVYYDTETTGLNITFKSRIGQGDQCVGIILSVVDGESFFFPMQMKSIKNLCGGDHFYFMEKYIRRILEDKKIVVHNLSFDWKVSYIYDINANIVDDTLTMIALTLGQEKKSLTLKLKELTAMFLHRDSLELDDLVIDSEWGENDIRFWDLPEELVRLYACADTDNTRGLHRYVKQSDLLTKYNAHKVYEIEIAFGFAVAYQEFYGHREDVDNLKELRKEIEEGIEKYYNLMKDLIGHDFNPNSPKQLVSILYKELGIPEQRSRKTGNLTTDKETLKKLGELTDIEGNTMYPFCAYLLKYREYEGVRKIIDKFPELATPDGYLFSSVMQFGTTTGRVSINNPNYQSYNDPVKKNIVPRPGFYMFDTDYSSVEYRVLGNMSGNKMIKERFYDPDFDYHTYQASRMYQVPYASVTPKLRKAAKGINFGLPYGMGDESLGIRIFGEASAINTKKAESLRRSYFKGQEDIQVFFDSARNKGVKDNFTETYFGRRRYYDRSKFSVSSIRRQAGNQVIQGTAADIYKLAVGRVFKRICKEGWLGKVLFSGFIHDELLGEVSLDIDPMKFLKVLREEFEVKIKDSDGTPWCPLYMGFGWGTSWYQAKKTEVPIKLQWEFVDKYGETGYPLWDGDCKKFCDSIPDLISEFEVRDCGVQLLDPNNQGKEIKPALNSAIIDIVKGDTKAYIGVLDKGTMTDEDIDFLKNKMYFSCDFVDEDYKPTLEIKDCLRKAVESKKYNLDTQDAIDAFCMFHNIDRSKVNILSIPDVDVSSSANGGTLDSSYFDDDEEDTASMLEVAINNRINTLGMYLDVDNKTLKALLVPDNYMQFIKSHTTKEGSGGYRLYFRDMANQTDYITPCEIMPKDVNIIQTMYIQYFKSLKGVK